MTHIDFTINSGTDEYPGCKLRLRVSEKLHVSIPLPPVIKPCVIDRTYEDRNGKHTYKEYVERRYGVYLFENLLTVRYGKDFFNPGMYGDKDQAWSTFLPWNEWRHVRYDLLNLDGSFYARETGKNWEEYKLLLSSQPSETHVFKDVDGEIIKARLTVEEREWRRGEGKFKFLSAVVPAKISRYIDIAFNSEVGKRKGSYKGGTTGHSTSLNSGETVTEAFKRYCADNNLTYLHKDTKSPLVGNDSSKDKLTTRRLRKLTYPAMMK